MTWSTLATVDDPLDHEAAVADAPALLAPAREALTYDGLRAFVPRIAGNLRAGGIDAGDRVALLVENGPEAASAFLAVSSVAAVAPLNPAYRAHEFEFFLDDLDARAVVVSDSLDTPVREVARSCGIRVLDLHVDPSQPAGIFTLDGVPEDGSPASSPDPGAVALALHTSGTTSRPKLVPLTHRQLAVSAGNVAETLRLEQSDRCLNVMPLFHIHGLVTALLASLRTGGSVACTPGFHQVHFFDWLDELEPTWYTAVPSMHAAVLLRARGRPESIDGHSLRFIRSSSAALPASVHQELESVFDVPVIEAYGMTEAAHQMASNPLPPAVRKPGTVGTAAGPEVAILDPSGEELRVGEIGEVAIRGESVFAGYETNSDAQPFTDGGWFRTGDEGFLDEEGYLTLRGRIKEIINRGGEKVSPLEVDDALLAHQGVAQAVTFAMSDPQLGEEVAAAVVLAPDAQLDERSLQDFVAAQLAPFKVPRRILVLDELPKGPTGKLQRIGLAERLGIEYGGSRDAGRRPYRFLEPQLIQIWESVLDLRGLDVGSDFFALGGDSILGAEAVARVRDLVGDPDLPLISVVRAPTPAAMASEVVSYIGLGSSGAVPLQKEGTRTPLFLVHPGDGELLTYPALTSRLGADQPSYGLRARGIDDDGETMPSSVPEIAADYVTEVQRIQPHGPYVLGGLCIGGAIAVEMASQLQAAGEEIGLIVLLDPRFGRPRGWRANLRRERRVARSRTLRRRRVVKAAGTTHRDVAAKLDEIREAYPPQPVSFRAAVFLSKDYERFGLPIADLERIVQRPLAWNYHDSIHAQLLLPPSVDALAFELRSLLAECTASLSTT